MDSTKARTKLLRDFDQDDPHEFILFLLMKLRAETTPVYRQISSMAKATDELFWKEYRYSNPSVVDQTFAGFYRTTITCTRCSTSFVTRHTFYELELASKTSVEEALDKLLGAQVVDKCNCSACQKLTLAKMQNHLVVCPEVLMLVLERFTPPDLEQSQAPVEFSHGLSLDKCDIFCGPIFV